MATFTHAAFGQFELLPGGTIDLSLPFHGRDVSVDLNLAEETPPRTLLTVLNRAADLPALDVAARHALLASLDEDDSAAAQYIEHHLECLAPAELETLLRETRPTQSKPEAFLEILKIVRVGLYPSDPDRIIVVDYSPDTNLTQYVLCVSFDDSGRVAATDMES